MPLTFNKCQSNDNDHLSDCTTLETTCLHSHKPKFHLARLDTTRHVRRVERVETSVSSRAVRQARHSQNAWDRYVETVVSCCVETWRDQPSGIWAIQRYKDIWPVMSSATSRGPELRLGDPVSALDFWPSPLPPRLEKWFPRAWFFNTEIFRLLIFN